jgi:hypothetical protein
MVVESVQVLREFANRFGLLTVVMTPRLEPSRIEVLPESDPALQAT